MESLSGAAVSRHPESEGIITPTSDSCFAAIALSQRESELERAKL